MTVLSGSQFTFTGNAPAGSTVPANPVDIALATSGGEERLGNSETGTLNIAGGGAFTLSGNLYLGVNATANGQVNLSSGGSLSVNAIHGGTAGGTSTLNLSGGTIQYRVGSTTWMHDLINAYVYAGGVTIDTQSNNGTISQALDAAAGTGITSITLIDGGEGYTAAPIVSFIGGSPINDNEAQAVATFDRATGKVTGIVIVNPGQYSSVAGLEVVLSRPAGTLDTWTAPADVAIGSTASNAGGGLTKIGTGTLTLTGLSTYTGTTWVKQGTLSYGSTGDDLDDASTVKIDAGGILNLNFDGTDTISELWLGGVKMSPGIYASSTPTYGSYFTGAGELKVSIPLPDANGDGVVDAADYVWLKLHFGLSGAAAEGANLDGQGSVDYADLQILMNYLNTPGAPAANTPEPCSAMLLVFGALGLLRRRR